MSEPATTKTAILFSYGFSYGILFLNLIPTTINGVLCQGRKPSYKNYEKHCVASSREIQYGVFDRNALMIFPQTSS
jgi:hypothetical protein